MSFGCHPTVTNHNKYSENIPTDSKVKMGDMERQHSDLIRLRLVVAKQAKTSSSNIKYGNDPTPFANNLDSAPIA